MISPIYDSKLFEKEDNKNIRHHIAQIEEQHNSVDRENEINTERVHDNLVDLINKNKQYFAYEENNEKITSKKTKNVVKVIKAAEGSYKYLEDNNIQVENTGDTDRPKGNRALTPDFVKLYIRYIERMFPDLADCVKIYYYKSDGSQDSGEYWKTVQNLKKQSRKSGKVYFIVNQVVNGDSGGHGNLTIVCSGRNFLYDTVGSHASEEPTGHEDYASIEPNITETKIQVDKWNCLVIVMGFMESFLKQFSKLREDWYKQKKSPSEWFLNEIQSPTEIELSDVIKTPDAEKTLNDMERRCLHTLLPKGYLQYLQTTTGIDNIVNNISPLNTAGHKYHKEITSIVNKLKKVQEKYFYQNYPLLDFLFFDEYGIESNIVELPEEKVKIKNYLKELIRLNNWDNTISILQVKDAIRNVLLCSQNKNSDKICNEDETDEVLKYSSNENRKNVKNELNNKHIYQVFAGGVQQFTTESAQELWNFCNAINNIRNYNFKAQMKRFTVVNKVASLVNVYTEQGVDVVNEINSVRNIVATV